MARTAHLVTALSLGGKHNRCKNRTAKETEILNGKLSMHVAEQTFSHSDFKSLLFALENGVNGSFICEEKCETDSKSHISLRSV
jgi:hypothetical protein